MFKRAFLLTLTLIATSAAAAYYFHIRLRPQDAPAFDKLIQESTELRTRHALEEQPAYQSRQGVQKNIWSQNETRHFQIQSEHSHLTLAQKKDKIEALEQLKQIRCSIQDDFTLLADEGLYTFPSHQFIAQKNCRLLKEDNYINGTQLQLDLTQEIVTYDNPHGYLAPIHFTAKTLIWNKKEGKIYLTDHVTIKQPDQFTLEADQGTLTLDQFEPTLLVLEGHVHLLSSLIQGKESYALADTLTYHPIDKTLLFSSPRRVLFWQEGLSLSASDVLIHSDQTVEGHGNVHFSFDLEEQNYIDELFRQYL